MIMSVIVVAQVLSPLERTTRSCAAPDCCEFIDESEESGLCDSCRANPSRVLERLGLAEGAEAGEPAGQTGSVGYRPIGYRGRRS